MSDKDQKSNLEAFAPVESDEVGLRRENERLATFILDNYPHEIGDETAVDVAIRLLAEDGLKLRNRTPEGPGSILRIFHLVVKERARQIVTLGYDEAHDDAHTPEEFAEFIERMTDKIAGLQEADGMPDELVAHARVEFVQIIATAVAALESLERKYGAPHA